jgi:hypothetical protein
MIDLIDVARGLLSLWLSMVLVLMGGLALWDLKRTLSAPHEDD